MDNFTLFGNRNIICGKSKSGKSCLLKYVLSSKKSKFQKIYVISGTEEINGFYSTFIPKDCIFEKFSEDWILKLITKLRDYKKQNNKLYNTLLVLDDLGGNKDFYNSNALQTIFTQGRHYGVSVCILIQYISQVQPILRCNANFVIVGQSNQKSAEVLVDEFRFSNIDRAKFLKMYNNACNNFGFLVVNRDSNSDCNNLNTIYGIIKTPKHCL